LYLFVQLACPTNYVIVTGTEFQTPPSKSFRLRLHNPEVNLARETSLTGDFGDNSKNLKNKWNSKDCEPLRIPQGAERSVTENWTDVRMYRNYWLQSIGN